MGYKIYVSNGWNEYLVVLEQSSDGGPGGAGSDGLADLGGVEVVLDQTIDDVGEVGLNQGDAQVLEGGVNQTKGITELKQESLTSLKISLSDLPPQQSGQSHQWCGSR